MKTIYELNYSKTGWNIPVLLLPQIHDYTFINEIIPNSLNKMKYDSSSVAIRATETKNAVVPSDFLLPRLIRSMDLLINAKHITSAQDSVK